ncbi:hypothetical protein [Piscibacillus halophilus]|uniref:hypothetical protein n=1 Tax=Piscibacillus halophilus TaxID=571933 RepID=UPI0024097813|nr:hypothetical protein [Piscibacillus halophilus]
MGKVRNTLIFTFFVAGSIWVLYMQMTTSSEPYQAVEKAADKEGVDLSDTVITHLVDDCAYTLYYTNDSYGFALSEKNLFGWKVVDFVDGLPLDKSLANQGYAFSKTFGIIHGIVDSFVEHVQIDGSDSNISHIPGENIRVWYNVNVTPDDAEKVKFIDRDGSEF